MMVRGVPVVLCLGLVIAAGCGDNARRHTTVGGTVSGLAGSGLVLVNNGGDDLVVSGNGTFAFPTALAFGTPYAVTVKTQPTNPTQTCMVASGSGTTGDDDITNVVVTCQTGVFSVGGTVSGLAGSGLVLQNNGTDDLAVDANGTFMFATPIASGTAFAVTVKTQPSGPTQSCTVSGGSGTVGGGPVTTAVVDCSTDHFTVGGIVSGLAGTVVLQNNGGDDISISANGSFAFPTTVSSGASYAVTVKTQPGTPSQTCVVSSGSGTVIDADITSVRVDCTTNELAIEGTVTGLVGSGLVLQNNAGDNLAISGNGTFTFATPVASGAAYMVTVLTQPTSPSQVCTVTNGSGTVGGVDVTDIVVTCVTSSFTIGGTVTGLAGTGLVLRDNGGDDLAIAGNGTFTFSTAVASGATYDVTVAAQPAGPAQTCTVSGGAGTVGGGDVTSITVNCTTDHFTIGGTITGLAGTVVLRDNGGDDLTLTANGTFAFSTTVPSGGTYDVTVATQPGSPSQTCTVTAGTGTVVASNVTSVAVSCVTNQFVVRGTVTGLAGSGLVLENNGGDGIAITGDGAFAFATHVASGLPYEVTVAAQPTGPSQTCVVSNGTGVIGGGDVTDVTVTCTTDTFRIRGTVTGLVGGGLVLRDNGGDDLAVSANGTFQFSTKVASGASYAVTVSAQPTAPWQTCTVTAGSGTVTSADITSVQVTCTTNHYTVGGTVTGLVGTGLVLQNNSGDDLAITGDGSFTFTTSVASGATFDVTILDQPAGPSQTCSVAGGTGTIGGAAVTSVSVNCTTNRYTVGGTVTGLAGSGFSLAVNGDLVFITANGSWSSPTTIASGDAYTVTVFAQPSQPSQTCVVTNGTGSIGGADVTNVAVSCTTDQLTVRGTLAGLAAGDTVVLRNNGADDKVLTANGSFAFPITIPSGGMYDVTVHAQPGSPVSQTCTVTGGSGVAYVAADMNITVTCTTNSFTVGGTVTGLTGTNLVLRNNGGNDLAISANGSFTFTAPVASGLPYTVTIAAQPSGPSPADVCTVINGSGTVGNANVTSVTISCAPGVLTFTNAGATGRFGPSQAQVDTAYASTPLAGNVAVTGGIQTWVVPATGVYRIEAWGARGGKTIGTETGGLGARMRGDFSLSQGAVLHILVGQKGGNGTGGGGGGGTFVVLGTNTPLVVAGGGGGRGSVPSISDANITTNGKTGDGSNPGAGGTNGNGGSGGSVLGPGGGGGFFTNGTMGTYNGELGYAYLNGGAGGHDQNNADIVSGGFGGGAGSGAGGHGAGGGGYSGGGASGNGGSGSAGGGGSFNAGSNQSNAASARDDHGLVTITRL